MRRPCGTGFAALALLVAALAAPRAARGHRLKLWAHAAEGATIAGQAYFSPGGGAAKGLAVEVLGPGGETLGRVETDEAGDFTFTAQHLCDHTFVAETPDGHRAEATVVASALPADLPLLPGADAAKQPPRSPSSDTPVEGSEGPNGPPGDPELARLVDAAVARHVEPLRRGIRNYEDRVRLHEVLGGVGYIVGLAGLALYFKARRRRPGEPS